MKKIIASPILFLAVLWIDSFTSHNLDTQSWMVAPVTATMFFGYIASAVLLVAGVYSLTRSK